MVATNECDLRGALLRDVRISPGTLRYTGKAAYSAGPTVENKGDGHWRLSLTVDRSGSIDVADGFAKACLYTSHHAFNYYNATASSRSLPTEMNFFFGVDLRFGNCATARLWFGQGHIITTQQNNWWIGGPNVLAVENGFAILRGPGDIPVYQRIRPGISDFRFEDP